MATVTLTPADTKPSQALAYENKSTHLRDASFSSYLSSADETFILKLTESTRNVSPIIPIPQESLHQVTLGRKKTQDGEISIFGAEKYFNGGMDEEKPRIVEKAARKNESVNLHRVKAKIKLGTPSACSEASYSSQSALLPNLLKESSPRGKDKVHGKRFFATFGFNCPCSDEKSVDVDENVETHKSSGKSKQDLDCGGNNSKEITEEQPVEIEEITEEPTIKIDQISVGSVGIKQSKPKSWFKEDNLCQKLDNGGDVLKREECFTFPVLNSGMGNLNVNKQLEQEVDEENARKSLEVFGSPPLEKEDIALLVRKLNMLTPTLDANPGLEKIPATFDNGGGMYDDIESDSSSDLFEIQSLSGNAHVTRTCYEPSEASIEWSVVTANAADFPAEIEYNEQMLRAITTSKTTTFTTITAKTATGKEVHRRRPSMSLGCKSHKAVKVAREAYQMSEKAKSNQQRHHRLDSFPPRARYQAQTKVTDYESAHAQRAFGTRTHTLSMSHAADASPSLYMH